MFLVLVACTVLTSGSALAGSGGTKKDSTISIRNDSSTPVAAFVDPDSAKLAVLAGITNPTENDIKNAGGQLVNAGSTVNFKVSAGNHPILVATQTQQFNASANVEKGKTKRFTFNGSAITEN